MRVTALNPADVDDRKEKADSVAEHKRMANYELLRIVAMVMVVVMHFLAQSDSLLEIDMPISGVRILGSLVEAFCLVAVNVYVFISGYFGVKGVFRPGKAVALFLQIWSYGVAVPVVLTLLGVPNAASSMGVYGLIQYIFPIETEHYWFATSYFFLYLLSPVLNMAAKNLSKRQMQIILGGLLILLCGIKSISPFAFAFDRYGYDLPWFICVYLSAAYLSLYGWDFMEKRGWLVYIGSALAGFSVNGAMWAISQRWDSFRYYFTVPFHYNYIFCLTGAIGLFYGFSRISIKEGKFADGVRRLGGLCFGVYLLHEHIDLRQIWYGWITGAINPAGGKGLLFFLWELLGCTAILFVSGILAEWIRSSLSGILWNRVIKKTKLYVWLKGLDRDFA
ncbi:MAG: acyltransferase [Lachnospiraceae bacterium]|nr:acyltransferase [Lachnospiraceae bacterium]